jgi:DNA-binding PadR family transcriptional regulator
MVRLGASSGYRIKKAADLSTQNFWPTSLATVYPELARLEAAGLLSRRSDPQGARERSAYTITEEGEKALVTWLGSTKATPVQIRDEAMLRLFLADALEPEDRLALVQRLRERNRSTADALRRDAVPRAEALGSQGIHYVAVAARLSADLVAYAESWLEELEGELRAGER